MASIEVKVPDIGDVGEVSVIELLVKLGDTVKPEQSLVTVESDKASMEIPSSSAGVVKEMRVALGDKVKEGTILVVLESTTADSPSGQAGSAPPQPSPAAGEGSKPAAPAPGSQAPAMPPPQRSSKESVGEAPAAESRSIEVRVPDIGDFKDVAVIELLVKPGDSVNVEQSLVTVESDKASMEIPSPEAGRVKELKVKLGDKVNAGDLIAVLEGAATVAGAAPAGTGVASAQPSTEPQPPPAVGVTLPSVQPQPVPAAAGPRTSVRTPPTAALPPHDPGGPPGRLPHASPSVRKFARELGVPLDEVKGTGSKGRITVEDVQAFTKAVMKGEASTSAVVKARGTGDGQALGLLPWPQVDFTRFGPIERQDLSRIRKIAGANLHRNWVMIPHVTNHDDADITELEAFRIQLNKENEKSGIKVTMLAFLIKACVAALKKFPEFNSSLDGEQLILKQYYHLGFAADTPSGLVVPVIRDADRKGILQISQEMSVLAGKARDGKLSPAEMSGASFTISSLGGIGGRYFTPIINAPEVAILGVCRSRTEPLWDGKQFQPRLMLPLSLSWDHRVVDGASAARFNAYLGAILSDFRRTML